MPPEVVRDVQTAGDFLTAINARYNTVVHAPTAETLIYLDIKVMQFKHNSVALGAKVMLLTLLQLALDQIQELMVANGAVA